jgi:hypothetical protein
MCTCLQIIITFLGWRPAGAAATRVGELLAAEDRADQVGVAVGVAEVVVHFVVVDAIAGLPLSAAVAALLLQVLLAVAHQPRRRLARQVRLCIAQVILSASVCLDELRLMGLFRPEVSF